MANTKFKVGDKVKVIGANGFNRFSPQIFDFVGKIAEITEITKFDDGDIGYSFNNETNGMENYCLDEKSLEKVIENKNWFNISINSEGDRTVATYTDRNGEQKVSVLRYKEGEYDPKVAIDYLMQKVDFSGAKAVCTVADDDWHRGDIVTYNGEKAEIVAINDCAVMLDFKFELGFTHNAIIFTAFYDKDGKPWETDGKITYFAVAKDDENLELIKAVRKVDVKIPEVPKMKPNPKDYPFAIGDRIYIKNRIRDSINNKTATVVAHDITDGSCLVKVDIPNNYCHKGLRVNGILCKTIVDENGEPYKFSGKPEYWWISDKHSGELIKDEKPIPATKFNIGDRVECTYDKKTGYGTVVAYSYQYGLGIVYLVDVDSKYRHLIPCHDGLENYYNPYIKVGQNWSNKTGKKAFGYFGIDALEKVK